MVVLDERVCGCHVDCLFVRGVKMKKFGGDGGVVYLGSLDEIKIDAFLAIN